MDSRMCKHCGKLFKSKSGLCEHEKKHEAKAPYKCCGHSFFSKANLKRHRCGAHGEKKTFKCDKCDRVFAIQADVKRHMKCHMDPEFKCELCGKTNKKKQEHDDHVATHSGFRKHSCECGKLYIHQTNLYRHRRKCQDRH